MRYLSIDIETTGLNPEHAQILEIGAVLDDIDNQLPLEELPTFHRYITHSHVYGDPYAFSMHPTILRRIATRADGYKYANEGYFSIEMQRWLEENRVDSHKKITPAGKNFASFDVNFLNKVPNFKECIKLHHRVLDPAMLYWNPSTDKELPNSKTCMERAGLEGEVAHTALEDAMMVVKLIRNGMFQGE